MWEGLLGGATYVNAFSRIHSESEPEMREFNLMVSSLADSFGINVAAWLSLWVECTLDRHNDRPTDSTWCAASPNKTRT